MKRLEKSQIKHHIFSGKLQNDQKFSGPRRDTDTVIGLSDQDLNSLEQFVVLLCNAFARHCQENA